MICLQIKDSAVIEAINLSSRRISTAGIQIIEFTVVLANSNMAAQDRKKEEKARELYNTDKPKANDLERKTNTG